MKIICEYVAQYPTSQQGMDVLVALMAGKRLTVAKALTLYGVYALSQRVGELKRLGWDIKSRTIKTPSGKHISEYWL